MKIAGGQFSSIEQVSKEYLEKGKTFSSVHGIGNQTFADVLNTKTETKISQGGLKFSKHASERLTDRNIELSGNQLDRLIEGSRKANEKGINESLVLMDQMAFIVNVKNNTVVTAMNDKEIVDNVFTNIDGAIIV